MNWFKPVLCLNFVFDDENYSFFAEMRSGKWMIALAIKPLFVTKYQRKRDVFSLIDEF